MHPESVPLVTKQPPRDCSCRHPLPRETTDRKGAARTTCLRCGRPLPLRLSAA